MSLISENNSKIKIKPIDRNVDRNMEIFYNPAMESNRNISILLLNSINNQQMNIADPLAGSGIRSIRFLQELKESKINHIFVNDRKELFTKNFNSNLKLNKLKSDKVSIYTEEASLFLLTRINDKDKPENFCGYFDFIDLDPFGSPNPFISAAIARICRNGILAITATDTAALTGTYPKTTKRKYWSSVTKNYMMHELGLRILIRKIQLQAMQFDKVLIPILAYFKDHYFRIYFKSLKSKEKCDQLIKQHNYLLFNPDTLEFESSPHNLKKNFTAIGPLWTGKLLDKNLIRKMSQENNFELDQKFLEILKQENDLVGFYDLHEITKKYLVKTIKLEPILQKLNGTRTHFSPTGIKTNKKIAEIIQIITQAKSDN